MRFYFTLPFRHLLSALATAALVWLGYVFIAEDWSSIRWLWSRAEVGASWLAHVSWLRFAGGFFLCIALGRIAIGICRKRSMRSPRPWNGLAGVDRSE